MKWYSIESIESTVAKSVEIRLINTNTEIITRNNGRGLETIASDPFLAQSAASFYKNNAYRAKTQTNSGASSTENEVRQASRTVASEGRRL
ncbi:hypothetical protein H8356DRAFT_1333413 [Neocallimastix lanati (nom. inval.)]|nr:hypothetical protein H8356DRAFT_1333413 [Neocallimastix sp. JGI-2020a]